MLKKIREQIYVFWTGPLRAPGFFAFVLLFPLAAAFILKLVFKAFGWSRDISFDASVVLLLPLVCGLPLVQIFRLPPAFFLPKWLVTGIISIVYLVLMFWPVVLIFSGFPGDL
ncbi:MAG: hypothetical protein ACAH80_09580 [Alphaproteobacteria bacterium]